MKPVKSKSIIKKVRAINGTDIFYTYSDWPTQEIDGHIFIPVVKSLTDNNNTQPVHWMKKDTMEYVK